MLKAGESNRGRNDWLYIIRCIIDLYSKDKEVVLRTEGLTK